ncbi:virulence-related protein [Paenibacillus sp. DMB5]|uniref:virulence-related protein n=1 Tax=Paenibacillus sp. DMB5 TaxID=1780103 RepID=UPI00076C317C|nr:virulence-related protein [Paenibacillus sp. DMB5]KUP22071.1 virulence-related protein [Paenibacillus sp. DMB5]
MDRKDIIKALSDHFGVKPEYQGAPSFAYRIEATAGIYTIDQTGNITTSEGVEVDLEVLLNQTTLEYIEQVELPEFLEEVQEDNSTAGLINHEVVVPMEGHTGNSLRNLLNLIYSKQRLIRKSLNITELIIEDGFAAAINESKVDTLENFRIAIDKIGAVKCPGIVFDFESNTIMFKLLNDEQNPVKIQAFTQLVEVLNQTAKKLKYTSSKPKEIDNDKFAFRLFLIRLGMIGPEYKTTRKVLLDRLEGNSAFKNSKTEKTAI